MHVYIHFLQLIHPKCVKIGDASKLLFFKTVATSYNLDSGRKKKSNKKTKIKNDDKYYLFKKPVFIEWISYCFTPFGCTSIVFYEFKFFELLLKPNLRKVNEESRQKAFSCFKRSVLYAIFYSHIHNFLKIIIFNSQFYSSLSFCYQIFFVWAITVLCFLKRFIQFKAIDAGLYEVGFYDNGFSSSSDFESSDFDILLTQKTIKNWSRAFNPTFFSFYSHYFSSFLSDPRSGLSDKSRKIASFLLKPLTKGFHGAVYLGAIYKKFFIFVEKRLKIIFKKLPESETPFLIFTQIAMISNRATMLFRTTKSFFLMSNYMHFIMEFLSLFILIVSYYLSKQYSNHLKQE